MSFTPRPGWPSAFAPPSVARVLLAALALSACATPTAPRLISRTSQKIVLARRAVDAPGLAPSALPEPGFTPIGSTPAPLRSRELGVAGAPPERLDWFLVDLGHEALRPRSQGLAAPGGAAAWEAIPGGEGLGWDRVYDRILGEARDPAAFGARALGAATEAVEPYIDLEPEGWQDAPAREPSGFELVQPPEPPPEGVAPLLVVHTTASTAWPGKRPAGWHLQLTGLENARERVRELGSGAAKVRVFHIDTGYAPYLLDDGGVRMNLSRACSANFWDIPEHGKPIEGDAEDRLTGTWESLWKAGFPGNPGHGTGTLGILAGRERLWDGRRELEVGGAPDVEVCEIRVQPTVVIWNSFRLARAIQYAADNGADVISLSMGGLPSAYLTAAVNAAYERGTAIFAAAGNHYSFRPPFFGWLLSLWLPRTTPTVTVYPAAYQRVMAVTGVTKDGRSYAEDPGIWGFWTGAWYARGNYGPPRVLDHTIAAYSPNIPWLRYDRRHGPADQVDLDGSGTSSATPQAAAAAALWLQFHGQEPALRARWRSWEKAQAVYDALALSARKGTVEPRYAGAGILDADGALRVAPGDGVTKRPPASADALLFLAEALLSMYTGSEPLDAGARRLLAQGLALELEQLTLLDVDVQAGVERLAPPAAGARTIPVLPARLKDALGRSTYASRFVKALAARMPAR